MAVTRFLRVTRHRENLPGQLEAIDRVLEGTDWRRVGYFCPPTRDIGLQRLEGRGGYPVTPATVRMMLEAHVDSNVRAESYGPLGYLISGDDELESA